jgi:LPXTG-motif cell wall-anchored protein
VPVSRLAAACACALALALPGTALAQGGAGDDQYTDPFGSQQATPTATARPAPTAAAAPAAPAATATPAPTAAPATATAQPAARAGAAAPATAATSRQLPHTGEPIWLIAAAGALLLCGGIALRARLRDQR